MKPAPWPAVLALAAVALGGEVLYSSDVWWLAWIAAAFLAGTRAVTARA